MLSCVRGLIVFRAAGGGIGLGPGDNKVLLRLTAAGRFLRAWTANGCWQIPAGLDSKRIMT